MQTHTGCIAAGIFNAIYLRQKGAVHLVLRFFGQLFLQAFPNPVAVGQVKIDNMRFGKKEGWCLCEGTMFHIRKLVFIHIKHGTQKAFKAAVVNNGFHG
jgi:hypothetical protein